MIGSSDLQDRTAGHGSKGAASLGIAAAGVAICLAVLISLGYQYPALFGERELPQEKVSIAVGALVISAPIYVALNQGFFRDEGLDVSLHPFRLGKEALESVLAGEVDMGTSAETPIMMSAMRGNKPVIVATIADSERMTAIVARKDRGITTPGDLRGKTIGIVSGTITDYLAGTFLLFNNIPKDKVRIVDLDSRDIVQTLRDGRIDAASLWEPYVTIMQKELGSRQQTYYSNGLYRATWNVFTVRAFTDQRPATVVKVLRALIRAEGFMIDHPERAIAIVSEHLHIDRTVTAASWEGYSFRIMLGQALLTNIEDQARWAIRNKLTTQTRIPNFLNILYPAGLKTINPALVSIEE